MCPEKVEPNKPCCLRGEKSMVYIRPAEPDGPWSEKSWYRYEAGNDRAAPVYQSSRRARS